MDLIKHDIDYSMDLFGLQNNANICYLNSLIQALSSCPGFVKTIFEFEYDFQKTSKLGSSLAKLFGLHLHASSETDNLYKNIKVESIMDILKSIQEMRSQQGHKTTLGNGTQEDVFEGFKFLIESLGEC